MEGMDYGSSAVTDKLAGCLYHTLCDVFTMYFMAHSYHWNVKGPEFSQFHDFFATIYSDVYSSVDDMAENLRKLGFNAPMSLEAMAEDSCIDSPDPSCNPMAMTSALYDANNLVIDGLYKTFHCANECNQQGIADFIAGRIDSHEKWRWQLGTTINRDQNMSPNFPGKATADYLEDADSYVPVDSQQIFDLISEAKEYEDDDDYDTDEVYLASASTPAPKKDRIYGSKKNKPDSATAKNAKKIKFSQKTEKTLEKKMKDHNADAPSGRKTTMAQLKAVYRRGAGAFSTSHRPGMQRDQWGIARVNAYLVLLKTGKPSNKNYTQDNDLLPAGHPKSTKKNMSITASAQDQYVEDQLVVSLLPAEGYGSAEEAIVALAEFSDMGYEMVTPLRIAWKRGFENNENPYARAHELATMNYNSRDADLLPKLNK